MRGGNRLHGKVTCPDCGKRLDAATGITDRTAVPGDGDYTVCAYCGAMACYVASPTVRGELYLRAATAADVRKMSPQEARLLTRAQQVIRRMRASRN